MEPSRSARWIFAVPRVRPVHLAGGHIQGQPVRAVESRAADQVFHVRAVQVASLDLVRAPVRPVQFRGPVAGGVTVATVMLTAAEQLFPVSDSPVTASTQAP